MRWLLVLFIVVPFVELYLLLVIGRSIGFWPTMGMLIVSGVLGATLAKYEGLRVWRAYNDALSQGRLPDEGILGGLLVLVGGVLLILPGVLTDLVGIVLLVPFTRRLVAGFIRRRIEQRLGPGLMQVMTLGAPPGDPMPPQRPMDGQAEVIDPMYDAPFGWERRDGWAGGGEVVDTEGVEVQSTKLLPPPGPKRDSGEPGGGGQESS